MAQAVCGSTRSALGLRALRGRRRWERRLNNWPPRRRRAVPLRRKRLLKRLSLWRRIAPVLFTVRNWLSMGGGPPFELLQKKKRKFRLGDRRDEIQDFASGVLLDIDALEIFF